MKQTEANLGVYFLIPLTVKVRSKRSNSHEYESVHKLMQGPREKRQRITEKLNRKCIEYQEVFTIEDLGALYTP